MLQSRLLSDTVQIATDHDVLILNSAADPFVSAIAQQVRSGTLTLAEDNIATLAALRPISTRPIHYVPFHTYILHHPAATMNVALMDLLYQPSNAWMYYGVQVAWHALQPGGRLYVLGAKDRGVLSVGKRMQEYFGNVETLTISKGHRVLSSIKKAGSKLASTTLEPGIFAASKLDEGTALLLASLKVQASDHALDIGCGGGLIGLHIARLATAGSVTMVDASLAAVAASQEAIEQSGLKNIKVLASDGAQAVLEQRFELVATNPPFHQGGIQTTAIAERFIREAAQVLSSQGRFYLVANRFLKYEPTIRTYFNQFEEVEGNTRYKVLRATEPVHG